MEQKYSAPIEKVFSLLTDPKWLEARSLALGEISAKVTTKKAGKGGVTVSMKRHVKRELPALVAKVLSDESDLQFEETWTADGDGYIGKMTMDIVGQPVKMTADFSLQPSGKGCIYQIQHTVKSSIPLLGGTVAKFAQGQIEEGCAGEFRYLVKALKSAG